MVVSNVLFEEFNGSAERTRRLLLNNGSLYSLVIVVLKFGRSRLVLYYELLYGPRLNGQTLSKGVNDIFRFLHCIRFPYKDKANRPVSVWSAPPFGSVKFNVNGSSLGKPGLAGIGGTLWRP
ncbi:hypothetical protein PTKIN_Ptkin14bG0128600 [Pterospermum kingtungense]